MSSIIDALKKSDAKRPRENHGLKIRMDLKGHSEKNKRWGFYALVVALVLILVAVYFREPDFIWQHLGSAEQPAVTSSSSENNKATTSKQTKKLNKPAPVQVQTMAQKQKSKSGSGSAQDAVIKQKNKPSVDEQANYSKASEAQKTQPVVVNNTDDNKPAPANKADNDMNQSTQIENQAKKQIDQQLAATPMKNKQAINASQEDTPKQAQPENTLPQLFELPYSIRKEIPKINLSVHVYDPVVENRMAIINGVPIHVGDSFEDLLTIQDITQSGVVLRIQDRDFIILK